MSEPVFCPACGRPASAARDVLTGEQFIDCDSAFDPCGPESIAAAQRGREAPWWVEARTHYDHKTEVAPGGYRAARGASPAPPGAGLPEERIRRARDEGTDVPALLAEVERLRAALNAVEEGAG